MKVFNIDDLPAEAVSDYCGGVMTKQLGLAAGSKGLYVNIDVLPPGTHSARYHSHTLQEEFFLVLEGEGELRLPDRTVKIIGPGDFISKNPGVENSHQFFNSSDGPLKILDIGTVVDGDLCYYPDEDVYLVRALGKAFSVASAQKGWTSDPDV